MKIKRRGVKGDPWDTQPSRVREIREPLKGGRAEETIVVGGKQREDDVLEAKCTKCSKKEKGRAINWVKC